MRGRRLELSNATSKTDSGGIELNALDPEFRTEVEHEPGGAEIARCYGCGTCTASCPVRAVSERYNPRQIIRKVLMGMREDVLQSDFIWLCSSCYACQERCPQGVKITDIMTALRNIAGREGLAPDAYELQKKLILEFGRLYEIDEFDNKKRRKAGLPEIHSDSTDIRTLFESVSGEAP